MTYHVLKARPLRNCKNGKSVAHFAMQACALRMDVLYFNGMERANLNARRMRTCPNSGQKIATG
jgi:hypothetical protein